MTSRDLSSIVRELGAKRRGGDWLARCLVHDDRTPSMSLRLGADGRLLVHCHAGCDQSSIIDALKQRRLWSDAFRDDSPRAMHLGEAERSAKAFALWQSARPAKGTLVETYLRARSIDLAPPPTLRFVEDAYHSESGQTLPALVAAVATWPAKHVTAVQRIFLRYDGSGKAGVEPAKKSLGPLRGGAVRLAQAGERIGIAEGIEDAMSAMQISPSLPCWATLGVANLATVVLPEPPLAGEVVIIADNDGAGMQGAIEAEARFRAQGRRVRVVRPPHGTKDLNEALRKGAVKGLF